MYIGAHHEDHCIKDIKLEKIIVEKQLTKLLCSFILSLNKQCFKLNNKYTQKLNPTFDCVFYFKDFLASKIFFAL